MFSCVYFVFKKASKPLVKEEKTKQMRRVLLVFLIGVPINIAMLIKLIIEMYSFEEAIELESKHYDELEKGVSEYLKWIFTMVLK